LRWAKPAITRPRPPFSISPSFLCACSERKGKRQARPMRVFPGFSCRKRRRRPPLDRRFFLDQRMMYLTERGGKGLKTSPLLRNWRQRHSPLPPPLLFQIQGSPPSYRRVRKERKGQPARTLGSSPPLPRCYQYLMVMWELAQHWTPFSPPSSYSSPSSFWGRRLVILF